MKILITLLTFTISLGLSADILIYSPNKYQLKQERIKTTIDTEKIICLAHYSGKRLRAKKQSRNRAIKCARTFACENGQKACRENYQTLNMSTQSLEVTIYHLENNNLFNNSGKKLEIKAQDDALKDIIRALAWQTGLSTTIAIINVDGICRNDID